MVPVRIMVTFDVETFIEIANRAWHKRIAFQSEVDELCRQSAAQDGGTID
jgi:hypothetical protein